MVQRQLAAAIREPAKCAGLLLFEDNPSNQKTGKLDPDMAAMQRFMASSHGVAIARAFGKIESSVLRARLVDLIEALT
jgi:hypothetical protein